MLPVSALAQKALDAIQAAMPQGETYFEGGRAVINLMKLVPSGSALARALLTENVWLGGDSPLIRIATSQDRSGRDEQEGFQLIFMGVIQGIRNPKAHGEIEQGDPQRTLEYLAIASLLMRRLDDAVASSRS